MPPYNKYESRQTEKTCWKAWWKYGTLQKASEGLAEEGVCNRTTNRPLSRFGIELAAWRYAMRNIPEAKEDFRKYYENQGLAFDEQEERKFYVKLVRAAKNVYRKSPDLLVKWLVDNSLTEYAEYSE